MRNLVRGVRKAKVSIVSVRIADGRGARSKATRTGGERRWRGGEVEQNLEAAGGWRSSSSSNGHSDGAKNSGRVLLTGAKYGASEPNDDAQTPWCALQLRLRHHRAVSIFQWRLPAVPSALDLQVPANQTQGNAVSSPAMSIHRLAVNVMLQRRLETAHPDQESGDSVLPASVTATLQAALHCRDSGVILRISVPGLADTTAAQLLDSTRASIKRIDIESTTSFSTAMTA